MSRSRAVATCKHCGHAIIYRHWNGHRAWTHTKDRSAGTYGSAYCSGKPGDPNDPTSYATPMESGKYQLGEQP